MAELTLPHQFSPREYQLGMLSQVPAHYSRGVFVWHRRAGKDKTAWNKVINEAMRKKAGYYFFYPTYAQGRKAIWEGIDPRTGLKFVDHIPPELISRKRDDEMLIELVNGSLIQVIGTDKFNNVLGTPPFGCVFSEYSLQDPRAWDFVRPILRENKGWAVFIYTPRGHNHGHKLYSMAKNNPDWYVEVLSVKDTKREDGTPVIDESDIDKDRQEGMDEALIQQEYYCSWEGYVMGSYYQRQMAEARKSGRVCKVPHQPGQEVFTFWDLGVDDSMTVWFIQVVGQAFHVIDYIEETGYGLEYYARKMREDHRGAYLYGGHYLPHDADAREMTNGEIAKSRRESAEELGIRPIEVVSRVKNADVLINVHIPAVRNVLARCYFDEEKCARGITALESYHSEFNEEKRVLSNRPEHDQWSHGADAFRTFAVGYHDPVRHECVTDYLDRRSA